MKVLVPIKRVVDYRVNIRVRADEKDVDIEHAKKSINPFDEIACRGRRPRTRSSTLRRFALPLLLELAARAGADDEIAGLLHTEALAVARTQSAELPALKTLVAMAERSGGATLLDELGAVRGGVSANPQPPFLDAADRLLRQGR